MSTKKTAFFRDAGGSAVKRCEFKLLALALKASDEHAGRAGIAHAKLLRCRAGEVDDAAAGVGAPVVDAHNDAFAVPEIRDPDPRAEGQELVGGREAVLVVGFAAGRGQALALRAVPGGGAGMDEAVGLSVGQIGMAFDKVGVAEAAPASAPHGGHVAPARQGNGQ